jgi:hypothetical protein
VGPVRVRLRHERSAEPRITSRVRGAELTPKTEDGYLVFEVERLTDHDVIVIDDRDDR